MTEQIEQMVPVRRFGRTKLFPYDVAIRISEWLQMDRPVRPLIQRAFPDLSADDREFILTGVSPEEWDKRWKED